MLQAVCGQCLFIVCVVWPAMSVFVSGQPTSSRYFTWQRRPSMRERAFWLTVAPFRPQEENEWKLGFVLTVAAKLARQGDLIVVYKLFSIKQGQRVGSRNGWNGSVNDNAKQQNRTTDTCIFFFLSPFVSAWLSFSSAPTVFSCSKITDLCRLNNGSARFIQNNLTLIFLI